MKNTYSLNGLSKFIILFILILLPSTSAFSQAKRNKTYNDYIEDYKHIAISHMKKYNIPASITLAQGLLESGAGKSVLTTKSNNHFGIKCHNEWKGQKVYHADDKPNDCFRKYKRAEESYDDHSRFLTEKPRYKALFSLEITDYRGWTEGLQKAGYATDKAYANKLIKIIEDYELYLHDRKVAGSPKDKNKQEKEKGKEKGKDHKHNQGTNTPNSYKHIPYKTHNLVYIIAERGDTYEDIALEFDFEPRDLYKYNEVQEGFPLKKGDLVYFQKKKSIADKPYYEHVVQIGESMHSISQLYGVKVKNLYKMNKKDFEYVPVEGDVLKLR